MNTLATVKTDLGSRAEAPAILKEAQALHEEALAMLQRLFAADHPDIATSLGNLAVVKQELGDLARVLVLQEEALAMRRRLFGGDHADIATSLSNLAAVKRQLGDPAVVLALDPRTATRCPQLDRTVSPYTPATEEGGRCVYGYAGESYSGRLTSSKQKPTTL